MAVLAVLAGAAACVRTGGIPASAEQAREHPERRPAAAGHGLPEAPPHWPRTRAERSDARETSTHADVVAFIDSLQLLGADIHVDRLATTTEGRELPYVIASRPLMTDAGFVRRARRPVVYVQANIHGGEVEGKEALLALLRDLLASPAPNVLDSLVLIAVPIYNADGNDAFGDQALNRGSQQGPAMIGQRANGQGLDLNRDYIKAEAPETRGSLALIREWEPDLFVDLHTTNGSYHGYALTYSPSLHPAAMHGGKFARDSLLPLLRARVRERHGFETFDYGNFVEAAIPARGWATYDHRPRFGTNYIGLRGRISVLSEAYSHDPFERRIRSTRAFVQELLSLVAELRESVLASSARADADMRRWGSGESDAPAIPLRAELTRSPAMAEVLVERVERTQDGRLHEPGMPAGVRRTGEISEVRMPVLDRFDPVLARPLPRAYALAPSDTAAVARLRLHGVRVERLSTEWNALVERFRVDSVVVSAREFQGHREVRVEGEWHRSRERLGPGSFLVIMNQPLAILTAVLLEPESDDGLTTWNVFTPALVAGGFHPVRRIVEPVPPARIEP